MSEEEIIMSEQQVVAVSKEIESEHRSLEKRGREDDSAEDEGEFITVQRAPKRRARGYSNSCGDSMEFKVCVTSRELLPKQFGMAKLLRSEKIGGISRITYKSPYKAIISFENRESGNKLIDCEKLISLGWRAQPADEMFLSYGIVRQVDLEETDEEILKNITSEFEIVSCVNCKGKHMAMYKECPTYLREKEVREIMTEKNCTYRNALKIYSEKMESQNICSESEDEYDDMEKQKKTQTHNYRSYRDVVVQAEIHRNMSTGEDEDLRESQHSEPEIRGVKPPRQVKQKTTKRKEEQSHQQQSSEFDEQSFRKNAEQSEEEQAKEKKGGMRKALEINVRNLSCYYRRKKFILP
ncbi:transcriptional regulator ATRX homolog [Maniola hyperantus]|uniref:transcriptional regulator ATRX homolog n=1 Tax=Aphantopus hyperantus TaxID=2795564 RepID=UPI0037494364